MHRLPPFRYLAPRSVEEALALWQAHPDARFLAGGTDLLARLRLGAVGAGVLIDVKRIPELAAVRELPDGGIAIGAAATVAEVASHPAVRRQYAVLETCCQALGSYPLRHRATVVGNVCNASPCADTAAALLALDARVVAVCPGDRRELSMREFFLGPRQSALRQGELVTEIRLPRATAFARGVYGRLSRRKGVDISAVAVLVARLPGEQGEHRVTLLSVAPTPLRVPAAEVLLDRGGVAQAAAAAAAAMSAAAPITDARGSAAYRREMVGVLLSRGVRTLHAAPAR